MSGDAELTVSVVIPSYRRLDGLAPLIDAYRTEGADQIVVVLDGPHAGWREALGSRADAPDVRVVELAENRGLALARIAGLEGATGDVILAVDDDVQPLPGLVDAHRRFHRDGGDRVLLGYMPVTLPARRGRDASPTYLYARDYEIQAGVWRRSGSDLILTSLWGGNFSLPRDLYERAERYKPSQRLEYNEDLDLGWRLRDLGAVAAFDDSARSAHHHQRGLRGYRRECLLRGQAIADLEDRWGERPAQLDPLVIIPSGYNPFFAAVQRRIAQRDTPGAVDRLCDAVYYAAGAVRVWKLQDGVARLLRRALAMRGYRLARSSRETKGRP
jgi:glycosyltransferase involved in cell wall biosynthesis